MEEKIIISGFGGQGIMFLGKLICQCGMNQGLDVTFIPSYGAEVRGGTAHCHVVLSDKPIASPVIGKATALIMMNEPSLLKFEDILTPGGLLIINTSLVNTKPKRSDIQIESISATEMAYGLGDMRVTNMIMLGKYIACRDLISRDSIIRNLKGPMADLNIKAIDICQTNQFA